jgi:Arc/MetJ-type ribon-helix-helix transcriptional regulator
MVAMKTLDLELSEPLAKALDLAAVEGGFHDARELIREAVRRYLESHSSALAQQFLREDIEWGLRGDD